MIWKAFRRENEGILRQEEKMKENRAAEQRKSDRNDRVIILNSREDRTL